MNTYYANTLYPLQDKILKQIDALQTPFYLTGGTVLSRYNFHHRYSDDLDFFVNNDKQFQELAENILRALGDYAVTVTSRSETYYSFFIDKMLKVDLVNDIPTHIGGFITSPLFSKIDTVENILSNKIAAVYSRDEPKDVVDIWIIATVQQVDWKQIFQDVSSKASGIFPPLIAERLETFPVELIETVKWLPEKKPSQAIFEQDIKKIVQQIIGPQAQETHSS